MPKTKKCTKCDEEKPLTEFYTRIRNGKSLIEASCKECQKKVAKVTRNKHPLRQMKWKKLNPEKNRLNAAKWIKAHPEYPRSRTLHKFGLTLESYQQLLTLQDDRCAICGTTDPSPWPQLGVDHCHVTNKVRGLLCNKCNLALGHFNDSPELCRKAANYLEQTK